jgi:hypothetical protein
MRERERVLYWSEREREREGERASEREIMRVLTPNKTALASASCKCLPGRAAKKKKPKAVQQPDQLTETICFRLFKICLCLGSRYHFSMASRRKVSPVRYPAWLLQQDTGTCFTDTKVLASCCTGTKVLAKHVTGSECAPALASVCAFALAAAPALAAASCFAFCSSCALALACASALALASALAAASCLAFCSACALALATASASALALASAC